ncbi:MAG: flagellar hook-length control protein FliK [Gammaproteobacteria bacterium]|nr:flagellar hook-length control protein FliK [Gammaproteobacteria bacterium]MBU1623783.1 flagellar hook-length control protein FliK [Gammaproteobacteria bacterium]MBU1982000.1 flagellar hook-length control protein FliK [Gammaproteobacteria bacterium]
MLPADLLASTLARFAATDKPLVAAATDKQNPQNALKLEVGQQVQATVQAKVAADVFQVKVANQTIQLQMPAFVRSGDQVTLQVVSLQPRLSLSFAASSNPLSTSEQLGSTARLLSSLSQQPIRQDYVPPVRREPLWIGERTAPDTSKLAGRLQQSLNHSGLFYESHQAQWIAGTRTTPQLMQETQNLLRPQAAQAGTAQSAVQPNNAQTTSNPTPTPLTMGGESSTRMPSIPEHLQPLVQQQMQALENKQVVWMGQAWQGQDMRWEVREEDARSGNDGDNQKQWTTELHLDLPNLGGVTARLSMNGNAVSLKFEVADDQTARTMEAASAQLIASLTAQGVPVLQTHIERMQEESP